MRENPKTRREDAIDGLSFVNFYETRERITVLRYFFLWRILIPSRRIENAYNAKNFLIFLEFIYLTVFSFQS